MAARIEHLVTSGTFSLDGQTFDVDNNVWLLGDDDEVLVIDAPHDPDAIEQAVGDRNVVAIACTHAHDDHVRYAPELAERLTAPCCCTPTTGCSGTSRTPSTSPTAP
jgi:glyoxylase-like metal-dependent hydrolase (beta-lactamase superfamily II)